MLEVSKLSISFTQYTKGLRQQKLHIIHDLHLTIHRGEIVAVVGSSGSGKSLLAHAILGILPSNAQSQGSICYKGQLLDANRQAALRGKELALIPQSVHFLDPLRRAGKQKLYPFQLSGGMARRVLAAPAVESDAEVIIADEPTPGLDPQHVEETMGTLEERSEQGAAVMLITHDLVSALHVADRIAVFYAGTVVEIANVEDFSGDGSTLRHPYSRALWQALPQNEFLPISGVQPTFGLLPAGCLFEPRCPWATEECSQAKPEMRSLRDGEVRCIHAT